MTQNPHTPPKDQQEDEQWLDDLLSQLTVDVGEEYHKLHTNKQTFELSNGRMKSYERGAKQAILARLKAREPQPTPTNDSDEQLREQLKHIWGKCNDRKPCAWNKVLERTAELARENDNHLLSTDYASLEFTADLIAQAQGKQVSFEKEDVEMRMDFMALLNKHVDDHGVLDVSLAANEILEVFKPVITQARKDQSPPSVDGFTVREIVCLEDKEKAEQLVNSLVAQARKGNEGECEACNGTGAEICDNPDHNFINAVGGDIGRIGCPLCGHDEQHRIPNTKCYDCEGTGQIKLYTQSDVAAKVAEAVAEAVSLIHGRHDLSCAKCYSELDLPTPTQIDKEEA